MSGKVLTYQEFLKRLDSINIPDEELVLIKRAYDIAEEAHIDQKRLSGEQFLSHPLEVANILLSIFPDPKTICTALLHDVVEDTDFPLETIAAELDEEIAKLVNGVTKISRLNYSTDSEYIIENTKKIVIGMSEDVRVIIIKLADRLHNMRTLRFLPEKKQKAKAIETLEIFAPLAHRLGLQTIKGELEDLGLKHSKPDVFFDIVERLNKSKTERDLVMNKMLEEVEAELTKANFKFKLKGRTKSIYSIYKKLQKGRSFDDIWDLNALRIFVDTEAECYSLMGILHAKYRPVPGRLKDFIANPKTNLYQSLHTTVFGVNQAPFEIQIRTYEMDYIAENGIAAHFLYKEQKGGSTLNSLVEKKLKFFKSILDLKNSNLSSADFVEAIKGDVLKTNIYVYTPGGDVIELPEGSSPIDFAYKIHTEIGDTTVGALIADKIVPLNYKLKTGNVLKIRTQKGSTPKKEWLDFVVTTQAKHQIKNHLIKFNKGTMLEDGLIILKDELKKNNLTIKESLKTILENISKVRYDTYEELLYQIGIKKETPDRIIKEIFKKEESPEEIKTISLKDITKTGNDILVAGEKHIKTNLAGCCTPIQGDEIIGIITKNNGITIHKVNCPNVVSLEEKTIPVSWQEIKGKEYSVTLLITSEKNNLFDIINMLGIYNIIPIKVDTIGSNQPRFEITIPIKNTDLFAKLVTGLEKIPNVIKVERLMR